MVSVPWAPRRLARRPHTLRSSHSEARHSLLHLFSSLRTGKEFSEPVEIFPAVTWPDASLAAYANGTGDENEAFAEIDGRLPYVSSSRGRSPAL